MLDGEEPQAEVYPHPIAFNVLPQVETFKDGDDYTTEERKMMAETRKILGVGEDELGISATCARVPVFTGHSESVNVQTRDDALARGLPRAARARARASSSSTTRPRASTRWRPRPPAATRSSSGRIRRDPSHERCLNLWIVGDNLRKGAATNAVQVAELLRQRGPGRRARGRRR